jgi:ribosomal protein S18 acetylase RimI-like enzyme
VVIVTDHDVSVRRAGVEDVALVARLLREFNAEFDEPIPARSQIESNVRAGIAGERWWVLLASDPVTGIVTGFVTVAEHDSAYTAAPVLYIEDLYVAPASRGQGVGSALMSRVFAEAATRGVTLVELGVDESDTDAMRFYERHGFNFRDPATNDRAFYICREL